jgi:homoserine dehydrogenase
VVADITAVLRDEVISIESLIQRSQSQSGPVPVVITTHKATKEAMDRAVMKIAKLSTVIEKPCLLQMDE